MDDETMRILAKASNLAGMTGQHKEALEIAEAIRVILPDESNAAVVQANALLHAGKFTEAANILRDTVLANEPDNVIAKAMLGLSFHAAGQRTERDTVLQEVIESGSDDENAVGLAKGLLHA